MGRRWRLIAVFQRVCPKPNLTRKEKTVAHQNLLEEGHRSSDGGDTHILQFKLSSVIVI